MPAPGTSDLEPRRYTSVWIDFFRASDTPPVRRLKELLQAGADICVTPQILQEILQGTRDEGQFDKYLRYFASQPVLRPRDAVGCAVAAARLYFDCRRRGITVRSSNDCLIAQIAMEHDVALLHDDTDFEHIAKVAPELRQRR
ncbi:MAG: PIN domain-containing protein [Thiohalocapsa sp.]|uniref:type II toxin-antitoxin system VapC family toxin n=1 Tax=Thiohalocapsa sp. TaxID=2497641 RepID=UPI0025DCCBB1|nr:PIN domain-containing protein [Thiohalocapsa sp.]MCG6939893.1 PIN domain-containing protein [Thiohalocapsa sp.]